MSREEYLAEFDELHLLAADVVKESPDEAVRQIEDLLIHAYMLGRKHTCDDFGLDEADLAYYEDLMSEKEQAARMADTIYKQYDGKDFEDKVREYVSSGDEGLLGNLIASEYHRDYNAGGESLAQDYKKNTGNNYTKTWNTMMDDRVRDTHDPLEGVTVDWDEEFYTWDNDHAPYPGAFEEASNNVNCRCWLTFSAK